MGLIGVAAIGRALRWCCIGGAVSLALTSCASYQSLPLDTHVHLKHKLTELAHSGVRIDQPMSVYDVAVLAGENKPRLLRARTPRGPARGPGLRDGPLAQPSPTARLKIALQPPLPA